MAKILDWGDWVEVVNEEGARLFCSTTVEGAQRIWAEDGSAMGRPDLVNGDALPVERPAAPAATGNPKAHISERVRGLLILIGFQLKDGVYSRTVAGVADAGTLSDGRRMVRLQVDTSGRWFEMLDGWGKVERDCDLRGFSDARDAVRHLVPALGVELDSVDEPDSVPVTVRGESVTLTPETVAATQRWFADNALECIAQARAYVATGGAEGFRVNDLESYVAGRQKSAAESLTTAGRQSVTFIQRAVALQTGDCVALLS